MKNNWFNEQIEDVEKELKTSLEEGLDKQEAEKRQVEYGFNKLVEGKKKSIFIKFLELLSYDSKVFNIFLLTFMILV